MRFGRLQVLAVSLFACLAFTATAMATPAVRAAHAKAAITINPAPIFAPTDLNAYPTDNWPIVGGNNQQNHYSALNSINTTNVAGLKAVWHVHLDGSGTGTKYSDEATPIVYQGVMYVVTGNDDVFALDAATGARLWTHLSNIPQNINTVCCGWNSRGLGFGGGLIFVAQLDGKLVALDNTTGQVVWAVTNSRWQDGLTMTMAPLYYNGLVIVGVSGAEYATRGSETAYDAKTGKQVWRFYTVPNPGDVGFGTWPINEWATGGATIWNTPTVDTKTGMIFFSTANATPQVGRGPGDDLFSASYVALDAMTGQYQWHFQVVHHDIWDYDCPNPTMIFPNTYGGTTQTALAETCKTGWMYVLNAHDGNPLLEIDEKPVPQSADANTSATQPIPVGDAFADQCGLPGEFAANGPDGNPIRLGCIYTPVDSTAYTDQVPGHGGGTNWSPNSYSPLTNLLYTCSGNTRSGEKALPNVSSLFTPGGHYTGVTTTGTLSTFQTTGDFTAMNVQTNKIAWKHHYVPPAGQRASTCSGGSLATAGGLVFSGIPSAIDQAVVAYDASTGTELWRFKMTSATNSPEVAYTANGQEFIGVYADGTIAPVSGGTGTDQPPSNTKGDSVYGFALTGTIASGG
jgi:quinohemoprotein ethanol dehydrogenase